MARPIISKEQKLKHGHFSKKDNKRGKSYSFVALDLDVVLKPLIINSSAFCDPSFGCCTQVSDEQVVLFVAIVSI